MNVKAKEQRNAYMREWRAKNKDKVKAAQERYWEKKSPSKVKRNKIEELYYQLNAINEAMLKDNSISIEFKKGFNIALNYVYQARID